VNIGGNRLVVNFFEWIMERFLYYTDDDGQNSFKKQLAQSGFLALQIARPWSIIK
jgi:maltose-binding protein MalE